MNIIITGASSGIGYHTALNLSSDSRNNIYALARSRDKLHSLHNEAKAKNKEANITIIEFDLVNSDYNTIYDIFSTLGEIDILINNAGLLIKKDFAHLTDIDWLEMLNVNLLGPVKLIKKLLLLMGKSKRSHIVNIASMGGFQGSPKFTGMSGYSAAKAALVNLTECLAVELEEHNISINCLAIGGVQTEMFEKAFPGKRANLKPEEMGRFIADFALHGSKYMNGRIVPVTLSIP